MTGEELLICLALEILANGIERSITFKSLS